MELDEFETAIEGLVEVAKTDPALLADPDSIVALHRGLSRLEAVVSAADGAFDRSGNWSVDGAKGAAPWLAKRCDLPMGVARRQVRRGRHMSGLPETTKRWLAGALSTPQVDQMIRLHRGRTEEALERDEILLLDQAHKLRFEEFARVLAYWEQLADPDGVEESELERRARRDVFLGPSTGRMWLGSMTLDDISGVIVAAELSRLEGELLDEDRAKAKAELGRDPKMDELCRTSAQRRADALVEMATRSRSMPPEARRPEPLFSVLVGWETLKGRILQLAQGAVVSPGSLVPWLDEASFERIVFAPGKRAECSITARFFTGATRRAIELRDQRCTHPYCDLAAEYCQADHIIPYSQGGETTQENGRLLCGFHNRLRNGRPPPDG
jgi:hypothetical protein